MLDVGDLGYGHRGGQRDGAPGAVAEPDRPQASVASDYSGRAQEPRRRVGCRRAPSGDHRLAQGGRDGDADGLGVEGVVSAPDGDRGIVGRARVGARALASRAWRTAQVNLRLLARQNGRDLAQRLH